jgi:hypothetical protein
MDRDTMNEFSKLLLGWPRSESIAELEAQRKQEQP